MGCYKIKQRTNNAIESWHTVRRARIKANLIIQTKDEEQDSSNKLFKYVIINSYNQKQSQEKSFQTSYAFKHRCKYGKMKEQET